MVRHRFTMILYTSSKHSIFLLWKILEMKKICLVFLCQKFGLIQFVDSLKENRNMVRHWFTMILYTSSKHSILLLWKILEMKKICLVFLCQKFGLIQFVDSLKENRNMVRHWFTMILYTSSKYSILLLWKISRILHHTFR